MGTLYVVGTPIGNLNDITFRALDILKNVDYIACEDTRQSLKLLNHYEIKKKLVAYHKFNENTKSNPIIDDLISGMDVAIITDAGTPCISDPGYILIRKAHENNINVVAVPGASAVVSSLSVSGLDTKQFAFIGFLPKENSKIKEELDKIKTSSFNTFVLYESPKRIVKLIGKLAEVLPDSKIYIASDLTKIHERGFYGNILEVYNEIQNDENVEKGEYAIVLEKNNNEDNSDIDNDSNMSVESKLVDLMVKKNITLKDAIAELSTIEKVGKKEIYNASLNLKNLIK